MKHIAPDQMQKTVLPGLTLRQAQALTFIRERVASNGPSPKLQEIADFLGVKSRSGAHKAVEALVDYGYLRRVGNRLDLGSAEMSAPELALVERTVVKVVEKHVAVPPVAPHPPADQARLIATRQKRTYVVELEGDLNRRLRWLSKKSGLPVERIIADAARDFVMG